MHGVSVREVMSHDPATCRASDAATEAARIMWERDCGAVPVLDEKGHVVGMVTDRDLLMAVYTRGKHLGELEVGSVMARSVVTCGPDDRLDDAGHQMARARVRRLPVVDEDGAVLGVLSINDIVRARAHEPGRPFDGVLETLSTIGEPRHAPMEAE